MKKIGQGLLWLFFASCTLMVSLIIGFSFFDLGLGINSSSTDATYIMTSSSINKGEVQGIESFAQLEDARAAIVANFLAQHGSPLQPYDYYGQKLVEIADRYELDFRFLPAIMMQESNLCKNIPEGTYNCLGFGIHSRGTLGFENYEAGFERAARELRANYVEQGRIQVSQIAKKYTESVGQWTNAVNQFMAEMKYDDRQMGLERKTDANVLEYVKTE